MTDGVDMLSNRVVLPLFLMGQGFPSISDTIKLFQNLREHPPAMFFVHLANSYHNGIQRWWLIFRRQVLSMWKALLACSHWESQKHGPLQWERMLMLFYLFCTWLEKNCRLFGGHLLVLCKKYMIQNHSRQLWLLMLCRPWALKSWSSKNIFADSQRFNSNHCLFLKGGL